MIFRLLGNTGLRVSEVGLGCEHLQGQEEAVVHAVVEAALNADINLLDVFMSEPQVRSHLGSALEGRRKQAVLQGHIGSVWEDGQYGRSRDLDQCKRFFEDFLTRLRTDYVDIGMLHFVDTDADFDSVFGSGLIGYAQELKRQGVIRAVGISSHNPLTAARAVRTGLVDVLMFSLNPAYDLLPEHSDIDSLFQPESYRQDGILGSNPARAELYRLCESRGVGITVMKSLGAGALLQAETSPFGAALTPEQCVHYALTRPAVSSVLVGCRTPEEVRRAVAYEDASEEVRDYSAVLSRTPAYSLRGKCMYCNHCLPCPVHIDVAQVNKYLDLAEMEGVAGPVGAHYGALEHHASECVACGACESRCPFDVPVTERMREAAGRFGI